MSILPEFKSTCKGDKTSAMLMYYGNFKKKNELYTSLQEHTKNDKTVNFHFYHFEFELKNTYGPNSCIFFI